MPEYRIAIVSPVHIPLSKKWVKALENVAGKSGASVIIVRDNEENGSIIHFPSEWEVLNYKKQRKILGPLYTGAEKLHRSSASKNIGHWWAYQNGYDIIIGVDSDCIMPENLVTEHLAGLHTINGGWTNPLAGTDLHPRGYPYRERARPTALSLGLWENVLDIGGQDRVNNPGRKEKLPTKISHETADGILPLSGMNFAVWAKHIPHLFFLPNFSTSVNGETHHLRRHDDIWGSYIFQRLTHLQNERIVYGLPIVFHESDVVAEEDAAEEKGLVALEHLFL